MSPTIFGPITRNRKSIYLIMGLSAPYPDFLFPLMEKGSKKIKACTPSFSLLAKFLPFAPGGAQGDLLKYFRSFPSPDPPSAAGNKAEGLRACFHCNPIAHLLLHCGTVIPHHRLP